MRRTFCLPLLSALFAAALIAVPALPVAAQASGWQPGPDAVLDSTYDGFIDTPAAGATVPGSGAFTVAGWFVDSTAEGWAGADDVQVWLGAMGGGGTMLAKAQLGQSRPDVATATNNPFWGSAGFSAAVNGGQVPAGPQTLSVYAHTPGKGWWFKTLNVSGGGAASSASAPSPSAPVAASSPGSAPLVTIDSPGANQDVSTKNEFSIEGTASDPGFGASGIDDIQVFINGERGGAYSTQLGSTTPNPQGQWQLTFNPTKFPSMHSNLFVYAHSKNTGKETLATREFNIVDK